jgi:hypothetical protein
MRCAWVQQRLENYTDGELSRIESFTMRLHLQVCGACLRDSELLDGARSPLRSLSTPEPPANLSTQLRVAMSIEFARGNPWQRRVRRWELALRDGMRPMAIRTLGGALSAVLLFSAIMPELLVLPVQAMDDVPLSYLAKGLTSDPELLRTNTLNPFSEDTTVLVYIDKSGNIYGFELFEEQQQNVKLRAEIARSLVLAEFEPATFFGQPVLGQVLITFTTVKG